jgi:hypothetical protein
VQDVTVEQIKDALMKFGFFELLIAEHLRFESCLDQGKGGQISLITERVPA